METGWYFSKFRRSFLQKPDGKGTEIVVIFFNGLLMVKEDWAQLLLQVPWLDAIISSLKVPDFISVSRSNAPSSEHQVLFQGTCCSHMLLSHFEPVLKFEVARPFSPEEKNHCEVMVITYRLGVGRRKSENRFGCVVLQFSSIPCLGSELAVNSPLSLFFPPFISPKTVWSPPQNPPTKSPFPPSPCSRGRWIMSGL